VSGISKSRILLSVQGMNPRRWYELLSQSREVVLEPDGPEDPTIIYAAVWGHRPNLLARLPNLRAIFSLGAGVDHILADPGLPSVPIIRVTDEDLAQRMNEYVVWRVLDHHRQGALYRVQQKRRLWRDPPQPAAKAVAVGIMGMGNLGRAAAGALLALGFRVNGWSRSERPMPGVTGFSGRSGLRPFLVATDILVVLLPLTQETRGIIDYRLLRQLRGGQGGAILINAGRGRLQRDDDILKALEDGTLKEASLDVFETEPLPKTSPLWTHPKVFVTPHSAAISDPDSLVGPMLARMEALERGEEVDGVVDVSAGY
jgi:glyoxylate/hydroxypyruvate reductase A